MTAAEKAGVILSGMGAEPDGQMLGLAAEEAEEELLSLLHVDSVPEGLTLTAAKLTAGEYLRMAAGSGRLNLSALDLSSPFITGLKMGDTQQTFDAGDSPQGKLDQLIKALLTPDERVIYAYRRLP